MSLGSFERRGSAVLGTCAWSVGLFAALALLVAGCSARGGSGGGRGGGGGGGGTGRDGAVTDGPTGSDDGGATTTDGGGSPRDARPTDGPVYDPDAPCEATEPVGATVIGDPPDMLLVVDISGSMCSPLISGLGGSMDTKLTVMKRVLSSQVRDKEARINFGLMLFPQGGECGAGRVRNPIAPRNADAIVSTLDSLRSDFFGCGFANTGATPTAPSIDEARAYYSSIPENPIGRYALLATDGLPNCGEPLPEGGTAPTVDETVAAIGALRREGVQTYVVGFGFDLTGDPDALMRMATAGGTGRPYSASNEAELSAALDAIAAEIIPPSCTVELEGPTRDPSLFLVRFDGGEPIPRDPARRTGWDYDPATNTITFYGPSCTRLQSGMVASVDVDFGCPGPLI